MEKLADSGGADDLEHDPLLQRKAGRVFSKLLCGKIGEDSGTGRTVTRKTAMLLHLQPEIAKAAEILNGLFVGNFGRQLRIQIGGGSVLAARYRHRLSTDLDLWRKSTPETPADERYRSTPPIEIQRRMAHEAWIGGEPDTVNMLGNMLGRLKAEAAGVGIPPEVEGIDVSFTDELQFPTLMGSKETNVVRTIFRPQSDAEILWGKLGRMKEGALTQRDLYDLAVMSHMAPKAVEAALQAQGEEGRREIVSRISAKEADKGKPLLNTTWEMEDLDKVKEALIQVLESGEIGMTTGSPARMSRGWPLIDLQTACRRKRGDIQAT